MTTAKPSTSTWAPERLLGALTALLSALALLGAAWFFSGCERREAAVHGRITLADENVKIAPTAVLYVIARPEGVTSGPPLAVKRFVQPFKFPIDYTLSEADVMVPNTPFEGKLRLTARIAQNGAATPAQGGDLETQALEAVEVGSKGTTTLTLGSPEVEAKPQPSGAPSAGPSPSASAAPAHTPVNSNAGHG